ncbi:hypothetical protein NRIC_38070 [Enterococcus florum]|uniref:Pentapeptide repeat protein n=1 Tax=Enterococcus florum TaxID=2480627 RepID=A0A4P5PDB7_9ENTE|nr:pentapeptide repeat-containing protein [Enterococcus florum]GCF95916.1 hypothetical protein NRIC_38070 [Enterococcus florum]
MKRQLPTPPVLPNKLVDDFYLEDEVTLEGIKSENYDYSYARAANVLIRTSYLKDVTMQRTQLERIDCSNVIFEKCNLSNLEWIAGSFHQVVFDQCKLTGVNFAESYLRDCRFINCVADFSSFSNCNFKHVQFQDCNLENSEFYELTWKHLFLQQNSLTNSNWMHTSLKELDVSDNVFDRIMLSADRLNGLITNQEQALSIAAGLGIKIVE